MKALVFENIRTPVIREVPIPGIGPHDVLIRVKAAGICGTDVHIYEGEYFAEFPIIPGHEFSGVVEDIGEKVTTVAAGDRVTADPNIGCGKCYFCKINQQNQCEDLKAVGVTRDGAFAEYVVAPEDKVFQIGELSFQDAAMIEPTSCVVWGLQQAPIPTGAEVLIFGAGPIGLTLLQLIKHGGASRVIMVEGRTNRIELAKSLGADLVVRVDGTEAEALKDLSPTGFDAVVDATGIPKVVERMIEFVRSCGMLVFFGVCPKDETIRISPYEIFRRDLKIYGSFALRNTFAPAIRFLQNEVVQVTPLLSHSFPFEKFEEALETMRSGDSMKVQLHP
jgi:2-desacetyl-2-hydroxyethyl bacteriochlorophyllide A dehydrogenase